MVNVCFYFPALCKEPCVNGECNDQRECKCEPGWTGKTCNIRKYFGEFKPLEFFLCY